MSQVQGASSYAAQWQYLQAIQQSNSSAFTQPSAGDPMAFGLDPFEGASAQTSGSGNSGAPFSLGAMSALISAQEQSGTDGLSPMQQKVFGQLDADGDGTVTGTELQSAFGADNKDAADYVMSKLDTNGDGSVSQSEFGAGTTKGMGHHHHHMHAGPPPDATGGAWQPPDPLAPASTTDDSTTPTGPYTSAPSVATSSTASSSGAPSDAWTGGTPLSQTQQNLLDQLIKLQSQLLQNQSGASWTSATLATI